MTPLHVVLEFGFSSPSFNGTESTDGVAGTVNAEVVITNGVTIAVGRTVVVNCIPSATGTTATSKLYFVIVFVQLLLLYPLATVAFTPQRCSMGRA